MNIQVLICKPGEMPLFTVIDNSLKSMQSVVGGYIEVVTAYLPGYDIVCNEEGLIIDLPMNYFGIRGTFFVCRSNEEGDFTSLTIEDAKAIMELLKINN